MCRWAHHAHTHAHVYVNTLNVCVFSYLLLLNDCVVQAVNNVYSVYSSNIGTSIIHDYIIYIIHIYTPPCQCTVTGRHGSRFTHELVLQLLLWPFDIFTCSITLTLPTIMYYTDIQRISALCLRVQIWSFDQRIQSYELRIMQGRCRSLPLFE